MKITGSFIDVVGKVGEATETTYTNAVAQVTNIELVEDFLIGTVVCYSDTTLSTGLLEIKVHLDNPSTSQRDNERGILKQSIKNVFRDFRFIDDVPGS